MTTQERGKKIVNVSKGAMKINYTFKRGITILTITEHFNPPAYNCRQLSKLNMFCFSWTLIMDRLTNCVLDEVSGCDTVVYISWEATILAVNKSLQLSQNDPNACQTCKYQSLQLSLLLS